MHWHSDPSDPFERPDVSDEERASNEMIKLVRKLRWIGQEAEADRVATMLRELKARRILSAPLSAAVRAQPPGGNHGCVSDSGEE
jgi:hypothetical protein